MHFTGAELDDTVETFHDMASDTSEKTSFIVKVGTKDTDRRRSKEILSRREALTASSERES